MSQPERYFYHSFPRRFTDDSASEIDMGLDVLSSIIASGFLLTPEITEWREPRDDGSLGEPWKNIQKTCCFTELSPNELLDHSKRFGSFSIEFDLQRFRELGGIPVFYLPRATEGNRGLESLAASLVARIGEIQILLNRLAELEIDVSASVDKKRFVGFEKGGQQIHTRCSYAGAEDLIAAVTDGTQPVEILRNALRALSAFFYPAEDFTYTGLLAYYRQREWRLIANMSHLGRSIDRDLTDPEKNRLLTIDSEFFGRKMDFFTGPCRRVDQCKLFEKLDGKPLMHYARRVIVPGHAVDKAKDLLKAYAEIKVIELEGLASR